MDASNRSEDNEVEEVDERNLAIVLGECVVPTVELNPESRLAVLVRALAIVRPHLTYFPEGKPLKEWLTLPRINQSYHIRRTAPDRVHLSPDLELTTRLSRLALIGDIYTTPDPRAGRKRAGVVEEQLMLTCNGEIVLWTGNYETFQELGHGRRGHRTAFIEEAMSSVFRPLNTDLLLALLDQYPDLCFGVVNQLHIWAETAVELRRKTLNDTEWVERKLEGILSRLSED